MNVLKNIVPKTVYMKTVYIMLALVTTTDAVLFSYELLASHSRALVAKPFARDLQDVTASARPRGYSAAGLKAPSPSISGNGWVVRYSSPTCKFCRADRPGWNKLAAKLVARGYRIYSITPYPTEQTSDESSNAKDETRIAFVDVGWMKRFRLTGTPTTLVFNGHGKLIWSHMGTMNDNDPKSALMALLWNR